MSGLTLGQLIEIYDNATPKEMQWMHDNIREWEKENPNDKKVSD